MKNTSFSRSLLFALTAITASAITASLFIISSCNDKDDDHNTYTVSGNATGAQENPPFTTAASGTFTGTYDANTNTLQYNITWTGLSGTANAMHLHGPAAVGVNAGIMVHLTITNNAATGTGSGTVTIVDSVENHLLNGNVYYNIHTTLRPGGEIRGQLTATHN
jgi:hypothetical protein